MFSALTLVSRLLGFVRESVIVGLFGAGAAADAFFVAFRIPNTIRQLLADGVANAALLPVLSAARHDPDPNRFRQLHDRLTGTFGTGLIGLLALLLLLAPLLVLLTAPGFWSRPEQFALATELLRLSLPYLLFASMSAIGLAALLSHARFWPTAVSPLWPNLALIVVPLAIAGVLPQAITATAIGLLVGGLLQLALPLLVLWRCGLLPRPRLYWRDPDIGRALGLLGPALLSGSVLQVNLLVGAGMASFLPTGSVSWLYLCDRLLQFPQGIFGIALAGVVLQHLTDARARQDSVSTQRVLAWAQRWALLLAVPATLAVVLLAEPLVWTVFGYGKFSPGDVQMCAVALSAMGLGLPAWLLGKLTSARHHAEQNRQIQLRAAGWSVLSNLLLGVVLVLALNQHGYGAPHLGVALAASAATWIHLLALDRRPLAALLSNRPGTVEWSRPVAKAVLAGLSPACCFVLAPMVLQSWSDLPLVGRFLQTGAVLLLGVLSYAGGLWLLGLRWRHLHHH